MDYKETIKERLKILSERLRTFILDENWRNVVKKIGEQFNFSEEKYTSFENEVFLVLLCFEPKTDFAENIKMGLGIDANVAGWVAEDVEKNIFSKVADEIDSMWQEEKNFASGEDDNESSGVGGDFEQIILNQAKAMQPAVAISGQQLVASSKAPENLPAEQEKPRIIHNYTGSDPYREPIR